MGLKGEYSQMKELVRKSLFFELQGLHDLVFLWGQLMLLIPKNVFCFRVLLTLCLFQSDFVTGPVCVSIVDMLPMKFATFLLGNDLAGCHVSAFPHCM